jgi:hypothetical protein
VDVEGLKHVACKNCTNSCNVDVWYALFMEWLKFVVDGVGWLSVTYHNPVVWLQYP